MNDAVLQRELRRLFRSMDLVSRHPALKPDTAEARCFAELYQQLGLPSIMGDALPEKPKCEQSEILREMETIVKTISAKNWRAKKAALLEMLTAATATNTSQQQ